MKTVWKFPLEMTHKRQDVSMPVASQIIEFDMQGGMPYAWAVVDQDAESALVPFLIVGTGSSVPEHYSHVGTCMDRAFVWHLFVCAL